MEKLSVIKSITSIGLRPILIDVEVNVGAGIPSLTIVGLPDKAVEEAKERVRLALRNSGFGFPPKKIVVNLAPADVKKEGPSFDLAIAVGILAAGGLLKAESIQKAVFLGELSLTGKLRPTKGAIQAAIFCKKNNLNLVLPSANQTEVQLVPDIKILATDDLAGLYKKLFQENSFTATKCLKIEPSPIDEETDFKNIVGQMQAKRAFEIAASGGHNILTEGSPGGGKTLLSQSIVSILPPLEEEEMLELTQIYSVSGLLCPELPIITARPFRSPHHTSSPVAIIGGGSVPKPGEVTLAHKGVLFMDEFPEFPRCVLEALRQPLEDHFVTVSRAQSTVKFPAEFILVAAKNPCPCGYYGDETKECNCSAGQIEKYNRRVSGPLLDRIDLRIRVEKLSVKDLQQKTSAEPSAKVRQRVIRARTIQNKRSLAVFGRKKLNSSLKKSELEKVGLSSALQNEMAKYAEKLDLSMRSYVKVLRVARTIADLSGEEKIKQSHLVEALQYRMTS